MHTVIVDECTGCDLCVEPCPVDCIDMIPLKPDLHTWQWSLPATNQSPVFHVVASEVNLIASDRQTKPEPVERDGNKAA